MAHTQEALYSNKIFLNAALPLVKVIANDIPSLKKKFENVQAVIQVSCLDPDCETGKHGMLDGAARPFTALIPIRRPVKEPGPMLTAIKSISCFLVLVRFSSCSNWGSKPSE